MKQYLLSVYQPEGGTPPPEVLEKAMREVNALNVEIKAAGAWVFAGGLHPTSTATVVRADSRRGRLEDRVDPGLQERTRHLSHLDESHPAGAVDEDADR
jgi:hypothetical protein